MTKPFFAGPINDDRNIPNIFSQPPPNFNWQDLPPPSDYIVPQNGYQTVEIVPQTLSQNYTKSYCKSCNTWTTEPYDSHINSQNHLKNKANELSDNSDQCDSIAATITNNQYYDTSRNNLQVCENVNISQLNIPLNSLTRINNHQTEQFNRSLQPKPKVLFIRPLIPQFNKAVLPHFHHNIINNVSNKRLKIKRTMGNIIQSNHMNFAFECQNNDKCEPLRILQISNESSSITANKGREMLLPISGIYCTLCEEFFRNTDSAETNHCASFAHINAYEKFTQLREPTDKKTIQSSKDEIIVKQLNPLCKYNKNGITCIKPPISNEIIGKLDKDIRISETSDQDMDFDQISSSEFHGPDFSLDFPDEIEDYE